MKNFLLVLLSIGLLSGCTKTAEFDRVVDYSQPFEMTWIGKDSTSVYDVFFTENLPVESEKSEQIRQFLDTHTDGWSPNIASVIGDVTVTQGDFRMIYSEGSESVSIIYLDKNNRPTQLARSIEKGELDFLFE